MGTLRYAFGEKKQQTETLENGLDVSCGSASEHHPDFGRPDPGPQNVALSRVISKISSSGTKNLGGLTSTQHLIASTNGKTMENTCPIEMVMFNHLDRILNETMDKNVIN